MSSTHVNPIGGNQYFKGLEYPSLMQPNQDRIIDLEIRTNGLVAGQIINIAGPLPFGTMFKAVSFNGHQQVLPGTTNTYGIGLSSSPTGYPDETIIQGVTPVGVTAGAPPADVGTTINGSVTNLNKTPLNQTINADSKRYINLVVNTVGVGPTADTGNFNIKIVYYTP